LGTTTVAIGTTQTNFTGINTFYITGTTDSSSDSTGVLRVAGGASVKKKLYVGSDLNVTGAANITGNTTITGNLTVNGTTTTINSTTISVDDKNIELGSTNSPDDAGATGGGITLKGTTDKTIIWDNTNTNWTSSEHWNIASGKSFKIATVPVLTATTVLNDSSQTSIGIGGYATTVSIAASTGTTTVNNQLSVTGNIVGNGDIAVNGGDITTTSTGTATVFNTNATTVNAFGAATTIGIGASTGTTTINSTDDASSNTSGAITVAGGVSVQKKLYVGSDTVLTGDLQVKGGDITTDQTTFNLLNTTATTLNIGGAATSTNIGSTSSGTTTINYDANIKHDLVVDGDAQIKGGDLTTNQTTFNVINTTATTVNFAGAATTIGIGASTGTLTVNNAATVFNSTSNIKLPVGDSSQRPGSPSAGMVRYNSEISSFEGYASGAWSSLGGVKSVDGLTYILAETSAGASNDELEFYTATDGSNTAKRGGWNKTRLLSNTPILVSSQASLTEYPNALIISSNGDTTNNEAYIVGVVGEGVASGTDTTQWGVGVYGAGTSKGATKSAGVIGKGIVYSTSDTGSAVGVRGLATDTHASGLNVGLYSDASGSAINNYALYMNTGDIFSGAAQTWLLKDNVSSALSLDATGKTGILKLITTDGAEGVTMSGTLGVTGVATLSSNASVGGTLQVTGNQTNTGDLAVNGGDITTTSTTATVFNTNATTVNAFGAATTLNIGASSSGSAINVGKDLYVAGNLYVTGTQSTGSIATVSGADSVVYVNAGATGNAKEIGIIGEYKPSGTTLYTGLLKDHTDSTWKFYSAPTNNPSAGTTQDFTGATYDAVKMGNLTSTTGTFSTALNSTGDFKVNTNKFVVTASSGNTTVAGTLGVTSDLAVNTNKFTVAATTGNTAVAGTLSVTGHVTVESVTSTGATGTGAFVFGTSPSLTTPTLGVASATSINKVTITAPATSATLTIADGKTLTASNTLTFTGTDSSSVAFGGGGTVAYTSNKLSVFAATSSSELAGIISDETGSGSLVFATSPTLVTPTLGVATATSINKMAITAPATSSTLAVADGKTFTVSNTLTLTGTDSSSVAFGTGGTVVYTSNKLSVHAATSSSELAGVISDETGTGVLVFGTAPTFTTSIDGGSTFGAFASSSTLTMGYTGTGAGSTTNISTAATSGAYTKIVNIGTAGTTGSTTQINIGSSVTGQTLIRGGLAVGNTTNTTDGEIRATGTITAYYSDDRLKDRRGNIEFALEKVLSLNGFYYTPNEVAQDLGYKLKPEVGLSAQEVQAIMPQVVVPAPIDENYLTIQYERLIPLLVEAIKEQQGQIEELKSKLDKLEHLGN
jgi:hypothetical protein